MRHIAQKVLRALGLQRLASNPHVDRATFTCHHRPGLAGNLLRTYCRTLKSLGLGRNACIDIAIFDSQRQFKTVPAGIQSTPGLSPNKMPVILVLAHEIDENELDSLVGKIVDAQGKGRFRPIFLIGSTNLKPFRTHNYLAEYAMPESSWVSTERTISYEFYLQKRIGTLLDSYAPDKVVKIKSQDIPHIEPKNWTR